MKYFLGAVLLMAAASASAEVVAVKGSGTSQYCYAESHARKLANSEAQSKAREACNKLGGRISGQAVNGSESVKACTGWEKGNYIIRVTDSEFSCQLKEAQKKTSGGGGVAAVPKSLPPPPAGKVIGTIRSVGRTKEEACQKAYDIAKEGRGECLCQQRGRAVICDTESYMTEQEFSLIRTIGEAMREDVPKEATPPSNPLFVKSKSASFGVRD